jgi:hypothetical protein
MVDWPYPQDNSLERARKVAIAYRVALQEANPDMCAVLDTRMQHFEQTWVLGYQDLWEDNDLITGSEAARLLSVTPAAVRHYRLRGYLCGYRTTGGWYYRVADVRSFRLSPPGRKSNTALAQ